MVSNSIVMKFKDSIGKNLTLTVRNAKPDVKDEDITAFMNTIVDKAVIVGTGGAIVEAVSANVVQTQSNEVIL